MPGRNVFKKVGNHCANKLRISKTLSKSDQVLVIQNGSVQSALREMKLNAEECDLWHASTN